MRIDADQTITDENHLTPVDIIHECNVLETDNLSEVNEKLSHLFYLFTSTLELATRDERIQFPTLFSRLAYVGIKYKLPGQFMFYAHSFRKCMPEDKDTGIKLSLGFYVVNYLIREIWKDTVKPPFISLDPAVKALFFKKQIDFKSFEPYTEGLLIDIDTIKHTITFLDEKEGDVLRTAHWNVADRNELFNQNLIAAKKYLPLPLAVNLIESEISAEGDYYPRAFVINPDFLVDVTSVSECFKENGSFSMIYLLNKFRDNKQKIPVLLGNMVNLIFEEIFYGENVQLADVKQKIFQRFGLALSLLTDAEMKEVWNTLGRHFTTLQKVVVGDFPASGIHRETAFLEASFYSRKFGIQGRLDLFDFDEKNKSFAIVELKSGSPWKPNVYGISASHFAQTQIYELLIRSVYDSSIHHVKNYILYSKEENQPMRFAPAIKPHHWEIMKVRNEIVIFEQLLSDTDKDAALLEHINTKKITFATGFLAGQVATFEQYYKALSSLEKKYFHSNLAFISREYSVAKVGEHGVENGRGHASLWLDTDDEKYERFSLIKGLKIAENRSFKPDPKIRFTFEQGKNIANFRKGDIVIIYPATRDFRPVLHTQLLKCTITEILSGQIEVKLRNKQKNQTIFEGNTTWNMEEDLIDSSFNKWYESAYSFIKAPSAYRDLFLGIKPPKMIPAANYIADPALTEEQNSVVQKALSSRDFFLIWGPPGTGKTNVVLKKLTEQLAKDPTENILLLAYTNRAVDEICQSVLEIGHLNKSDIIRIGSRVATNETLQVFLLDSKIEKLETRQELRELIQSAKIIIGTVSSILGKPEIFQLKKFSTVIVDEASQILEPMLCGLLEPFSRRILIGDHRQLPAIVRQKEYFTRVDDELVAAGILNLSYSLFDRMIHQYKSKNWFHAMGTLTQQGRMHEELQSFVNNLFYEKKLRPLEGMPRLFKNGHLLITHDKHTVFKHRNVFLHVEESGKLFSKVNPAESKTCIHVIKLLTGIFSENKLSFTNDTIGIITPFRAQIARIQEDMRQNMSPSLADKITVDTVERYQGGARDIILFSLCVHNTGQLKKITSEDKDGIDRKLNVTLTRAREQIIMIGNIHILSANTLYKKWIDDAYVLNAEDIY